MDFGSPIQITEVGEGDGFRKEPLVLIRVLINEQPKMVALFRAKVAQCARLFWSSKGPLRNET